LVRVNGGTGNGACGGASDCECSVMRTANRPLGERAEKVIALRSCGG
jgi:hypothetical protein